MEKSPWSKVPVLSPEDQIEYDKMRRKRDLISIQERIYTLEMADPPQTKHVWSENAFDDMDDVVDYLAELLRRNDR